MGTTIRRPSEDFAINSSAVSHTSNAYRRSFGGWIPSLLLGQRQFVACDTESHLLEIKLACHADSEGVQISLEPPKQPNSLR
jgi:hypothetical protein